MRVFPKCRGTCNRTDFVSRRESAVCIGSLCYRGEDHMLMQQINTKILSLCVSSSSELFRRVSKISKATVSFFMYVCVCVRLSAWNSLAPTGRTYEI